MYRSEHAKDGVVQDAGQKSENTCDSSNHEPTRKGWTLYIGAHKVFILTRQCRFVDITHWRYELHSKSEDYQSSTMGLCISVVEYQSSLFIDSGQIYRQ